MADARGFFRGWGGAAHRDRGEWRDVWGGGQMVIRPPQWALQRTPAKKTARVRHPLNTRVLEAGAALLMQLIRRVFQFVQVPDFEDLRWLLFPWWAEQTGADEEVERVAVYEPIEGRRRARGARAPWRRRRRRAGRSARCRRFPRTAGGRARDPPRSHERIRDWDSASALSAVCRIGIAVSLGARRPPRRRATERGRTRASRECPVARRRAALHSW